MKKGGPKNFGQRHYFRWRESDDPLAKGDSAVGCYAAANEIDNEVVRGLENAYQKWVKAGRPGGNP